MQKQRFVWNRRGNGLIEIEIYKDRTHRSYKSTGIRCEHWDSARGKAYGPGSEEINRRLRDLVEGADLVPSTRTVSVRLLPWMRQKIAARKLATNTEKNHLHVADLVRDFDGDPRMTDITPRWLALFNTYLTGRGCADTSVYYYHSVLAAYLMIAVREGLLDTSPYMRYRAQRGTYKERHSLTSSQLDALRALELDDLRLAHARDFFLIMAATGMAYVDSRQVDPAKVKDGWYEGRRTKTGHRFLAPVTPEAMGLIEKYGGTPPISYVVLNEKLHALGKRIGLPFTLTSHVARHTFVTLSLERGVSPAVVQRMAGHASITMTETYMHPDDSFVKDGAKALF